MKSGAEQSRADNGDDMIATDTRIHSATTGKIANLRAESCNGVARFSVIFGSLLRSGEFQVSHAQPSRTYKTEAGATKAALAWVTA